MHFLPGISGPEAALLLVIKNSLGDDYLERLEGKDYEKYPRNLAHTFNLPHGNELTLRVIYFFRLQPVAPPALM